MRMGGIALQNAVNQGGKEAIYILVHISESAIAHWMGSDSSDFESIKDKETLVEYKKQMIENGYKCEIELGFGNPRKAIPQIVKNANADVLVMGAHGHKALMDFILGSSVDAVRHQLDIPVLVVTKDSVKS